MFFVPNKYIFMLNKYIVGTIQMNIYRNLEYIFFSVYVL